jgi:hypothetical protein
MVRKQYCLIPELNANGHIVSITAWRDVAVVEKERFTVYQGELEDSC